MEKEKSWDEFVARQVLAELKGEKVQLEILGATHYYVFGGVTHCYVFGSLGTNRLECWYVSPAEKRVYYYVRLL